MSETATSKCRVCQGDFVPHPMGSKNNWSFVACKLCGSVMVDPWPTTDELEQYFADIQPEVVHRPDYLGQIAAAKKEISKIIRDPAGKTFLDPCCRYGYAVEAAWELGMKQPLGTDPHDFFHRFGQQKYPSHQFLHSSAETLATDNAHKGKYDLIYLQEAFCESLDPNALAAAIAALLAPGGKAYIEEPDGNHFNVPKDFTRWAFVDPPFNFLYISKNGMQKLLSRHGLKIEKTYFSWRPALRMIVTRK